MKYVSFFLLLCIYTQTQAQESKQIILSGLLLDKQHKTPIEAGKILLPSAGHGTLSNEKGVFMLKVVAGDSLVIRSFHHRTAFYKVPADAKDSYAITLLLEETVEMLAPIQVYPYSDKDSFREAFLSIDTETEEMKAMRKNLDKGKMQDAARHSAQDSKAAAQEQLRRQAQQPITSSSLPTLNIFSPTAWREFMRGIRQSKNEKARKEKNYKD